MIGWFHSVLGRWPCGGSHVFDIGCGYQRSLDPMLTQQVVMVGMETAGFCLQML